MQDPIDSLKGWPYTPEGEQSLFGDEGVDCIRNLRAFATSQQLPAHGFRKRM